MEKNLGQFFLSIEFVGKFFLSIEIPSVAKNPFFGWNFNLRFYFKNSYSSRKVPTLCNNFLFQCPGVNQQGSGKQKLVACNVRSTNYISIVTISINTFSIAIQWLFLCNTFIQVDRSIVVSVPCVSLSKYLFQVCFSRRLVARWLTWPSKPSSLPWSRLVFWTTYSDTLAICAIVYGSSTAWYFKCFYSHLRVHLFVVIIVYWYCI